MKTSELTGAALDWAVAKCVGGHIGVVNGGVFFDTHDGDGFTLFEPTVNWAQGGPIIEREDIALWPLAESQGWGARKVWGDSGEQTAPTPLIAAMRCLVASKLGDNIDIPEELK